MADGDRVGEIEEEEEEEAAAPLIPKTTESDSPKKRTRTVRTKVPEAEVQVYRNGKGPIDVFTTALGGWDQDQLEIREILEKYGFKSVYAFTPGSGRGVPIRFNPRNGRSMLTYRDGAVVYLDGEPKDSLLNPITKILVGVAAITAMIVLFTKEVSAPEWAQKFNFSGGYIPPWVLACAVIVFTRMRKRTKTFLENYFH
ncbi:uncharacterized protein LOC127248331 [Andrographis paniculata]|uniref:uncharacterized protein LOC127248331 n=1 Tax=Andrographis paniculata TaxID=175694 RepID=UPI0021E922E5|nr:uncharacterized protein LOC127248331 [Andrographis paniculata]XP_051126574.1 uncharacterized protein LOC127248331 [Andrographis paniculata]